MGSVKAVGNKTHIARSCSNYSIKPKITASIDTKKHSNHYVPHLITATINNDTHSIQKIFQEAAAHSINIGDLAFTTITKARNERVDSNRCKNLEEQGQIALIREAILTKNGELLNCRFTEEPFFQNVSKETIDDLLTTLSSTSAYAALLKQEINAIGSINFEYHRLQPLGMLAICMKVQKYFESKMSNTQDSMYLRRSVENLPRSVVINFKKKNFTILSKQYGKLDAHGTCKRVTDAVQVLFKNNQITAKRMVRAVNHFEKTISNTELLLESRYGQIDTVVNYPSKRDPTVTKTTLIQDAYDSDLYAFTAYTPSYLRKKLSTIQLIQILETIGNTIAKMHSEGAVHRDLKTKNILFKMDEQGAISIKVCDFGHATYPQNHKISGHTMKRHGTIRYSPPEVLKKSPAECNPFEQLKAVDMFGLGVILYELLLVEITPWSHDIYRALKGKGSKKEALKIQYEGINALHDRLHTMSDGIQKNLLQLLIELLHPNPDERIKIDQFQKRLQSVKQGIKNEKDSVIY